MRISTKSKLATEHVVSTLITTIILSISILPILLFLSEFNINWVLFSLPLLLIGNSLIFYPFIVHVYPHLMSKLSLYLLSSILIVISLWVNITFATYLLPNDYIYYTLLNVTFSKILLFGLTYLLLVTKLIIYFTFDSNLKFYKEESLF